MAHLFATPPSSHDLTPIILPLSKLEMDYYGVVKELVPATQLVVLGWLLELEANSPGSCVPPVYN